MSKKKEEAAKLDVLASADRCDARANECADALPTMAQEFREAARMLRVMHAALMEGECKHTITFNVTKEMNDKGRDVRAPGKYCMLCGELMAKPEKPPKETQQEGTPP